MNLHFEPITSENRKQAEALELYPYQDGYIESVKECLKEADELELWRPVGIYDDSELVGFSMYGFFPQDAPEGQVWLDRLLIDRKQQGKGYGRTAVTMLLKKLEDEYQKEKIYLSVYDNNERAIRLYEESGFRFNGEYDTNGEKVMVYETVFQDNSRQLIKGEK